MREKTLKLYVWEGVLCAYYCGMAVAVAHDVEEARETIFKYDHSVSAGDLNKNPRIIYLTKTTKPVAFTIHGTD